MALRKLKMLPPKHQYSSTSVRVTQTKAKEMHLEMDLACTDAARPANASRAHTMAERKCSQI